MIDRRPDFKQQLPDRDPAETEDWVESLDSIVRHRRRRARPVRALPAAQARPPAGHRPAGADPDALHQHHLAGAGAGVPGRRGDGAAHPAHGPLERGGHGPARQLPRRRASAATSPRTPPRRACTRWASTTSSGARTRRAWATRSSSRATPRPASMPARSSRGGCPRTSSTTSGGRSCPGRASARTPIPRLMPDFWEFPTVSMGLGPLSAIYQARFNRYLHNRGIKDTSGSRVWAFLGDGETDEPESLGRSRSPPARASTTSPSWSTATSSDSMARCAATARSSRSWSPSSGAPAGT